jgi:dipeptidase
MMKTIAYFKVLIVLLFLYSSQVYSCTNILISKGASSDGSVMISYVADSHTLYGELYYRPANDYAPGSKMQIYDWDSTIYLGNIRQALHTYSVVGNMNEHQLTIGETTFGGRDILVDRAAKLDYGNLIYITMQRARTARAAIDTIATLLSENGYHSEGESFSIADPNEVWIMEIVGKGSPEIIKGKNGEVIKTIYNRGAVWVARRIPDGYICAHANQSRIKQFPLNDPTNCVYSQDVISFAREKGWFKGADKDFSFADTYVPLTYEALRLCEARVYSIFRRSAPSLKLSADYVEGKEGANPLPLWIKPDTKIGVKEMMALMRDHYEGTDLDMTNDFGAGPYKCPYRWRPLTWKVDSVEYFNERAISTQQTGFSFISQSRSWLPDCIGGMVWFGVDDTYSTVYMPVYCSMQVIPESLAQGNGNLFAYSETSAFWTFNFVSNWAYTRYSDMIIDIQKIQHGLEDKFLNFQPSIEKTAQELFIAGKEKESVQFLNDYSVNQVSITTNRWKQLGHELLVKYIDGNVKDDKGNVTHPPYPQWWYKKIINQTNDHFKVKKLKSETEKP